MIARTSKRPQTLSLIALILSLGFLASISVISYWWANSRTILLTVFSFMASTLYAFFAWWYHILRAAEITEIAEQKTFERESGSDALFDNSDSLFTAARSRQNFEKYILPLLTAGSGLLLIIISISIFLDEFWGLGALSTNREALSVAGFASLMMILTLLIGSYFNGVSREPGCRWLRPIGLLYLLVAFMFLVATCTMLLETLKYRDWDFQIGKVLAVVYLFLGMELLVNVVLDFYRTKRKNEETVPIFESRSLSFFTEPSRITRNVSEALYYQFGLKVSDAWLSNFFTRKIIPSILAALLVLYALDCIVTVDSDEKGILETYGFKNGYSRHILAPGIHVKLPRPLAFFRKYPVNQIQTMSIGYDSPDHVDGISENQGINRIQTKVISWDHRHFVSEQHFLTANKDDIQNNYSQKINVVNQQGTSKSVPVNFLSVNMQVQYKIDENALFDYCDNYDSPEEVLRGICDRELVRHLASKDLFAILGSGLLESQEVLTNRIHHALTKITPLTGIEVLFISLTNVHPPVEVAPAFQRVVAAGEEKAAALLQAEGNSVKAAHESATMKIIIELESEAYRIERIENAQADADRFFGQKTAFQKAPEIFKARNLMAVLNDPEGIRRFFIHGGSKKVIQLNLEDPLRPDLLNDLEFENEIE